MRLFFLKQEKNSLKKLELNVKKNKTIFKDGKHNNLEKDGRTKTNTCGDKSKII